MWPCLHLHASSDRLRLLASRAVNRFPLSFAADTGNGYRIHSSIWLRHWGFHLERFYCLPCARQTCCWPQTAVVAPPPAFLFLSTQGAENSQAKQCNKLVRLDFFFQNYILFLNLGQKKKIGSKLWTQTKLPKNQSLNATSKMLLDPQSCFHFCNKMSYRKLSLK